MISVVRPALVAASVLVIASCSEPGAAPNGKLLLQPAAGALLEGDTVRLAALFEDRGGQRSSVTDVTWQVADTALARIESGSLVRALAPGTAVVRATWRGIADSAVFTVAPSFFQGAGDIAKCGTTGDDQTAALLDTLPGAVFTTGDDAYPDGSAQSFATCYDPTWGRARARTYPSPGNHDYTTPGAPGYFDYFGARAGAGRTGYYSFDLGAWHIVSLNSEISTAADAAQARWLQADLAAHPAWCILASWHRPRFSSGANHGGNPALGPFWDILYAAGADIVLNGHDHEYERFRPQDPSGTFDPARGITEWVVGTGGAELYSFATPEPNSAVRLVELGVLRLRLAAGSYRWWFITTAGAVDDSGAADCHQARASR